MEIKVTVELGEKTVNLLQNLLNNAPAAKSGSVTVATSETKATAQEAGTADLFTQEAGEVEKAPEPKTETPKRTRRSSAEVAAEKAAAESKVAAEVEKEAEAPKKEVAPDFADLDEDAQLEEIKAYVTRNTKKGKSADVKALLAFMEAGRASELAPDQYETFYDLIVRYTAGEAVDVLTGADLD